MNNSINENKNELRRLILQSRDEMDFENANRLSETAAKNVINSDLFKQAENIMVFASFRSEIDTIEIMKAIFAAGKKLYLPLCIKKTNEIVCCLVYSLDDLETSNYGISEPKKETLFIGDCRDLDLIIVPGAAFDMKGHRIGYGAGYYDRLLSRPGMKAINLGLCFDLQIVPAVPNSPYDVSLDYLCTEKGVYEIEK